MNFSRNKKNKGFTMLFAVLVSVIVLAVGASIINIAIKQVVLSGIGRESQYAFYAANTGVECALYWDLNFDVFAETTSDLGADKSIAKCAEVALLGPGGLVANDDLGDSGEKLITSSFSLNMDSNSRCVDVDVIKNVSPNSNGVEVVASTTIMSRGYNNCDENSPRRVERGLQITY